MPDEKEALAYVPGCEYDLFISYSHLDNVPFLDENMGWVDSLCDYLKKDLQRRLGGTPQVWLDNLDLRRNEDFNTVIKNRIGRSALFLVIVSPNYVNSLYCRKELEWFQKKHKDLWVDDAGRILEVTALKPPGWTDKDRLIPKAVGYPFYQGQRQFRFGDADFKKSAGLLGEELVRTLGLLWNKCKSVVMPRPFDSDEEPTSADDLWSKLNSQLHSYGFRVPPRGFNALQGIEQAIQSSVTSVYIMGSAEHDKIRTAIEKAAAFKKPFTVCVPSRKDLDGDLAAFFRDLKNGAEGQGLDFLKTDSFDRLWADAVKPKLSAQPEASRPVGTLVYVICDAFDTEVMKFKDKIPREFNVKFPAEVDPYGGTPEGGFAKAHEALLGESDGVLLFCGPKSESKWVNQHFTIVSSESLRARSKGVYLTPPDDDEKKKVRVDASNKKIKVIEPPNEDAGLADFLEPLRGRTASAP
jgi:hypothetical protein